MVHLAGNTKWFNLVANYTLSRADTWGCLLGELFDYVDGVCQQANGQLNAFGPGDYGPSGENVTSRFVLAGTFRLPGGFVLSTVNQFESARPITITDAANTERIYVNGVYTSLDEFRGRPYMQTDLRVTRPFKVNERWTHSALHRVLQPFQPQQSGANYAVNVVQLPIPQSQMQPNPVTGITNVTSVCTNPACTTTAPITNLNQLEVPEGALGRFLRTRYDSGHSLRGADRIAGDVLKFGCIGGTAKSRPCDGAGSFMWPLTRTYFFREAT